MTEIFHKFRQMLNGKGNMENKHRIALMCFGIGLIHLFFCIGFAVGGIWPMFWYNIFIVAFYMYNAYVESTKEHYKYLVVSVYTEIMFCSVFTTVMLGWNWGFSMYTLSMIPVTYYVSYMFPFIKRKIFVPSMMSTGIGSCFVLTRVFCGRVEPFYDYSTSPSDMQISFYYFNIIVAFTILILFSTLFATEIIYMQKKLEKENIFLGEAASYDPLTHLLNRRSMTTKLKNMYDLAATRDVDFCVMMLDVDDFKKINDKHGHDCGDDVLIAISKIISNDVREGDAVCRWGGEEILVMIKADLTVAKNVAERICKDIRDSEFFHAGRLVNVTLTVGIAAYDRNITIPELIDEADRNMYYGKQHGKDQIVTSEDIK